MNKKGITVYCGSAANLAAEFLNAATEIGKLIALAGVPLITGAGRTGMMGAVADAAISAGGETIGVIPRFMVERGWNHQGMSTLHVVETMHLRKAMMAELSSAAIALPGGIGTFEELCEIITWRQLGLYGGNVVILNTNGYYDSFLAMIAQAISNNFMHDDHMGLFTVAATPAEAVAAALSAQETKTFSPKF